MRPAETLIALEALLVGVLIVCTTLMGGAPSQWRPAPGAIATPFDAAMYNLHVELPPGVPLCGALGSSSRMEWFYVPVDPATRCEQFTLPMDWERWPDFVVIGPYIDIAETVDTLDGYVSNETFFCGGALSYISDAGQTLMSLKTASCIRKDVKADRYATALLAYKPRSNDFGRGYMIGAYVHMKNKQSADRLIAQIAKLLKPIK